MQGWSNRHWQSDQLLRRDRWDLGINIESSDRINAVPAAYYCRKLHSSQELLKRLWRRSSDAKSSKWNTVRMIRANWRCSVGPSFKELPWLFKFCNDFKYCSLSSRTIR
jgi:hypothetical protein